jgi:hypothetical protein
MERRRLTWLIRNTLVAPIIVIRMPLFIVAVAGEWAAKALMAMPGLRHYDGWKGW